MYLGTVYHCSHQTFLPLDEAHYIKPLSQTIKPKVLSSKTTDALLQILPFFMYPKNSVSKLPSPLLPQISFHIWFETVPSTVYTDIRQALHLVHTLLQNND